MRLLKFAAIDIGTNAVRLFFSNVIEDDDFGKTYFSKSSIMRMPIRLGEEVFVNKEISRDKIEKLVLTIDAYKKLMQVQNVISYRACATSAMREASNGEAVVAEILERTGVQIDVISGTEEAELIYLSQNTDKLDKDTYYLTADLGGGSLEFTLFSSKKTILSHSFNIGTIRLLNHQVSSNEIDLVKIWLKKIAEKYQPLELIGSGGNINKLFSISQTEKGKPLKLKKLKEIYSYLSSFSFEERLKVLELNPDRADVIIPAAEVFMKIMKWLDLEKIFIPVTGLSDGIVHKEYLKYKEQQEVLE